MLTTLKRLLTVTLLLLTSAIYADHHYSKNISELEEHGFTVVENVFTAAEITELAAEYKKAHARGLEIISTVAAKPRKFSENNGAIASMFWKTDNEMIVQAGKGRYDYFRGFNKGVLASDLIMRNPKIEHLMQQVLKNEYTAFLGIINSEVNSADQYWHRDSHNLTSDSTDGSQLITMENFHYTILIPVVVPFNKQNGTTEFMPGTHKLSSDKFVESHTIQRDVPLGAILILNGKVNHRGKANLSTADRPTLYLEYHKRWYNAQYRNGLE